MIGSKTRMSCASHIGGRAEQQDSAGCFVSRDGRARLLVVADGMGGHQGGELASRTVIEVAERLWNGLEKAPENPAKLLEDLCRQADDTIRERGKALGLSPYSTVAALLVTDERAYWTHVGDSRIYGFRGSRPFFRTEDHTLVQELVRAGKISEAEASAHPEQHKLLRGLGGETPVQATPGQTRMTRDTGFILCTDGFWATIRPEEMQELLAAPDPSAACARWAALAAGRGGEDGDNVTVALLQPRGRSFHRKYWPLYAALAVALPALMIMIFR